MRQPADGRAPAARLPSHGRPATRTWKRASLTCPKTLHERTGERVAELVDEYDKPILDARAVEAAHASDRKTAGATATRRREPTATPGARRTAS